MGYQVSQDNTTEPLLFLLVSSVDHITPLTGASPTVTLSKNGGAFASPAGAISEVGNGWYAVAANATDANTLGPLVLHATATSADPADDQYDVVDPLANATSLPGVPTTGVVSFTATSLITGALRLLSAIAGGETLEIAKIQALTKGVLVDGQAQNEALALAQQAQANWQQLQAQHAHERGMAGMNLAQQQHEANESRAFEAQESDKNRLSEAQERDAAEPLQADRSVPPMTGAPQE